MRIQFIVALATTGILSGCSGAGEDTEIAQLGLEGVPADALLPDVVEEHPTHLSIHNQQQHEWLRFSSTHWNEGEGPLQIRGANQIAPCDLMESGQLVHYEQCTHAKQELLNANGDIVFSADAGVAVFHVAHNHWHQNDVADFVLRAGTLNGPVVAQATKITYCLIDYDKSDLVQANSTRVYFDCNGDLQGISRGWGDEYHHSTSGQEIEVSHLPAGTYYLTHAADPTNHWIESDDTNNGSWVKFQLTRNSNAQVNVTELSPCEGIACGNSSNK